MRRRLLCVIGRRSRGIALAVWLAGCGFSGRAPAGGSGDAGHDARATDAITVDAPVDAQPVDSQTITCAGTYILKHGGHSYRPLASNSYLNLVAACHNDPNGYVVAINDATEDVWVQGQLTSSNNFIWIGLHYTALVGWVWDDGTALAAGYENFTGPPPDPPSDPCVDVNQVTGEWLTFTCTQPHPALCECNGP